MGLEICAIGGFEYVGNNMVAIKSGEDVFIFDAGVSLPALIELQGKEPFQIHSEAQLRNSKAIPNDLVLDKLGWTDKVRAIFIGHAHLDHVGAIVSIIHRYPNAVIMGTAFTIHFLETLYKDKKTYIANELKIVEPDSSHKIVGKSGTSTIDFIHITHSTIQCSTLALHTKDGTVCYAVDFKFDDTPVMGPPPNYKKLKEIGKKGVKVLIINSLSSGEEGRSLSEAYARDLLDKTISSLKNDKAALFISTFSSQISRLKSIVDMGKKTGRQIIFLGWSMEKYTDSALKSGMCPFRNQIKVIRYRNQVNALLRKVQKNRERYLIVCTGHQAEQNSILDRITKGATPFMFKPGDDLIFASRVIPVKDNIAARKKMDAIIKKQGVIIHDNVHSPGHGREEDVEMMTRMIKPEYIIPTHGFPKQEQPMVEIAKKLGYKEGKTVFLTKDGNLLKFG